MLTFFASIYGRKTESGLSAAKAGRLSSSGVPFGVHNALKALFVLHAYNFVQVHQLESIFFTNHRCSFSCQNFAHEGGWGGR